jgi:glycosyltransferase involved in cell wall biosynthesis
MTHQTVSIIVPIYNERETAEKVLREVRQHTSEISGREIIAVDDGSTDGLSQEALAGLADVVITHSQNSGYGAAIKSGLRRSRGETIVIIDADDTYPAEEIPRLVERLDGADLVVGARTGASVHVPILRQPAKWLLVKLANYLSQRKIPDLNSGLRVFRKAAAEPFLHLCPNGFSFTTTLTLAFMSGDLRVDYVPINYRQRKGRSKIRPLRDTHGIALTIVRSILYFNPLRVCIPLSAILAVLAIAVLLFSGLVLDRIMDGTVAVLTLTAVQVLVIGLLADLIVRRSNR